MLNNMEFEQWFRNMGLPSDAKKIIENIRNSPPSRAVGGGKRNVSGKYPSKKMGCTIQFESHRVELAGIYEMEHDPDVLEFYDQPFPIKLNYADKRGRNLGIMSTPDYFVIRKESATWEEWKTGEELVQLANRSPNRYMRDENENWRCPPGEEYAKKHGLYYRLRSSSEINWILQRNLLFLEDYILDDNPNISPEIQTYVLSCVSNKPGIKLSELIQIKNSSTDDIYAMIAHKNLYINLHTHLLTRPETIPVYKNVDQAKAIQHIDSSQQDSAYTFSSITIDTGSQIMWDGKEWTIINNGEQKITLLTQGEKVVELSKSLFRSFVQQKKIIGLEKHDIKNLESKVYEILMDADEDDLKEANDRYKVIQKMRDAHSLDKLNITERTIRNWVKKYQDAQRVLGSGYIGLIPQHKKKGNQKRKLPEPTLQLMDEFIDKEYETIKQQSKKVVYSLLRLTCENKGILEPSYKTFCKAVDQRSKFKQTQKRQGNRAAYRYEPFYWQLDMKTPRHGERPFEICHVDHTQLDVELVSSNTGRNLGRPWVTFLVDAYSRKILLFHLTFESPSYRSTMMVLRECVRKHARLPQTIVVDGGKEFHSVYFESLLAQYEVTKKTRPAAKARFGNVVERLFGTANTTFIHNLMGQTKIMKNVRQVTKSVNPKNHATWTLAELYNRLNQWVTEIYDTMDHPALGTTPREYFQKGIALAGTRPYRFIPYDEAFVINTMPTTKSGKAKVQVGNGVKIYYRYFWCDEFKDPEIQSSKVQVRYDPLNAGIAYAYVRGKWRRCISEYYSAFQGRTEKEMRLITAEIRKRDQNHSSGSAIYGKKIAQFLNETTENESLLLQKIKDHEVKATFNNPSKCDHVNPS